MREDRKKEVDNVLQEHQKKRMGSWAAVLDQSQRLYSRFQHDTVLSQLIKRAELSVSCWSRVSTGLSSFVWTRPM